MITLKQALCVFLFVIATAFVGIRHGRQQPKMITVSMPAAAWQVVYDAIDNAPIPGETRKPILKTIIEQVNKQLADTTKQKK